MLVDHLYIFFGELSSPLPIFKSSYLSFCCCKVIFFNEENYILLLINSEVFFHLFSPCSQSWTLYAESDPFPPLHCYSPNYYISLLIFCFHPSPSSLLSTSFPGLNQVTPLVEILQMAPNLSRVRTKFLSLTCKTPLILHSTTSELSSLMTYLPLSIILTSLLLSLVLEHIRNSTSGPLHLPFPLPGLLLLPISTWLTSLTFCRSWLKCHLRAKAFPLHTIENCKAAPNPLHWYKHTVHDS